MIPIKDHNPTRRKPYINILLIAANLSVFIYQVFYAPRGAAGLVDALGVVPHELLSNTDIGTPTPVPIPLTLLSAMFIHGGWLHFFGNMLYLWIFGDNVEDRLGHGRYLLFYLSCGVIAALVHIFVFPQSRVPCVGASGAISGVLAAYLFFFPRARVTTIFIIFFFIRIVRLPAVVLLGLWIVLQAAGGLAELSARAGGIAWFAHIGGFGAGALLALVFRPAGRR